MSRARASQSAARLGILGHSGAANGRADIRRAAMDQSTRAVSDISARVPRRNPGANGCYAQTKRDRKGGAVRKGRAALTATIARLLHMPGLKWLEKYIQRETDMHALHEQTHAELERVRALNTELERLTAAMSASHRQADD